MELKPYWIDYHKWECYQNGMYNNDRDDVVINKCVVTFKQTKLEELMYEAFLKNPTTSKVHLYKEIFNRRPFAGQIVNNYLHNATIIETTEAWLSLTSNERKYANDCANNAIERFIKNENI